MNKSVIQRIEHLENALANDLKKGEVSPALQESIDRLLKRVSNEEQGSEEPGGGKQDETSE